MQLSGKLGSLGIVQLIGAAILGLFVLLRIYDPQPLIDLRHSLFDTYQKIKPREYVRQPITIVDLDEESLREFGQWPWPRTTLANLVETLTNMGAVVIAFDGIFSEQDRLSPDQIAQDNKLLPPEITDALSKLPRNDKLFADAIKNSRVVLGQTSVRERSDNTGEKQNIIDTPHAKIGEDPTPFLDSLPELIENRPELEAAALGKGVFSIANDPDGIVRRLPLVLLASEKLRAGLALETLRVATGGDSIAIKTSAAGIEGVVAAGQLIETNPNGKVWVYFSPFKEERYLSAASVLKGEANADRITNHIIMVGTSAIGLEDIRPIPLGRQVPGVEIHVQALENILTNTLLNRGPRTLLYELIGGIVGGLLIIFIAYRLGASWASALALLILAGFAAFSWWGFSQQRVLYDASWPAMTTLALSIVGGVGNYIREEKQRQQIQGAFGQYLSPALVEQLSNNPERLVLGGESRELSVLFTDVRGFTTISESYRENPQGLTKLMNEFLTTLSQPILNHNGTIDKYMGDAIMAFWNAPLDEAEHAEKCCLAALDMISEVAALNKERKEALAETSDETYHAINVGIGINTGLCVVGNMGSNNRFDYTALGDTVNLASRLEGQSKPYGLPIVIGAATAEAIEGKLATFEIDLIRVKGKNEPANIYCLVGDKQLLDEDDFTAFRALNRTMIAAYRIQQWETAFEALEKMEELGEKLSLPLEEYIFIYETRIAEFRANPPGGNWDGVYTANSK